MRVIQKRPPSLTVSTGIKSHLPDEKPITDPEKIAAYVRSARIVYGLDVDEHDSGKIDNPPIVIPTPDGAKVRAWLPAALARDAEIELDERRAVETTPSGAVARVWLPVSFEGLQEAGSSDQLVARNDRTIKALGPGQDLRFSADTISEYAGLGSA